VTIEVRLVQPALSVTLLMPATEIYISFARGRGVKYCDEYVCLSICLSTWITQKPHCRTSGRVACSRVINGICDCVCVSACQWSRRKTAWPINTKLGRHRPTMHDSRSEWVDFEVKRSNVIACNYQMRTHAAWVCTSIVNCSYSCQWYSTAELWFAISVFGVGR